MTTIQKIKKKIENLPENVQKKILDYVENLSNEKDEHDRWAKFSLNNAMKGIETGEIEYFEKDLKEKWT